MSAASATLADMPRITVRLSDEEDAQLGRLVAAIKTNYERMAVTMPVFYDLARTTNRSSALKTLLAAWDHGQADTAFNPQNNTETP